MANRPKWVNGWVEDIRYSGDKAQQTDQTFDLWEEIAAAIQEACEEGLKDGAAARLSAEEPPDAG